MKWEGLIDLGFILLLVVLLCLASLLLGCQSKSFYPCDRAPKEGHGPCPFCEDGG